MGCAYVPLVLLVAAGHWIHRRVSVALQSIARTRLRDPIRLLLLRGLQHRHVSHLHCMAALPRKKGSTMKTKRQIYQEHQYFVNSLKQQLSKLGDIFQDNGQTREANYYFSLAGDVEHHQNRG